MRSRERLSPDDWRLVRRMYENATGVTIAEIALLAGMTERPIYERARLEGWVRNRVRGGSPARPPRAAPALDALAGAALALPSDIPPGNVQSGDGSSGDAPSGDSAAAPDRPALIAALWQAVRLHVAELQAGARRGVSAGAPADGRAAQSLMTVVRTVGKLMDMERADAAAARTGRAGPAHGAGSAGAAHASGARRLSDEEFRNEIARRLEALEEQADDDPGDRTTER